MSARSSRPGPQSLVALGWLGRVGASPGEPLAVVMGWSRAVLHDHVARLTGAGLVRRVAMTRGEGSLIVVTRDGARMVGVAEAPREVAPTSWAHTVGCAWVGAWFAVRGRPWVSSREIAHDQGWRGQVVYEDGYGRTQRLSHRPDLGTFVGDTRRPVAVEVELQRKSSGRLRGILAMYATRTGGPDGELAGVVYITAGAGVAAALRTTAVAVGLGEHPEGRLRLLVLEDVVAQTRQAGAEAREAAGPVRAAS